ncbi:helix-turn-helix domain-containing protein [Ruminiclostridium herbifermentans]|uniref:Helix-turn-helix domain-containing protein n=2 Tax=Ruminiclostridium herbifermentans TaxID=2488810 RepID=A0A4U7JJ54_9FIRM|nr:helix-turn-helix domain-containing protein [Ruminiclostridium herbifermentans]
MLLTPKDVKEYLDISHDQVYRLFRSKKFPAERSGKGKYIIPKPRFLKWLGVENN